MFYKVNQEGFTLLETIAVLILLAILIAVAIERIGSTSSYSVASEAAILKNNIRFAQLKSIADISTDTWVITVTSGYYYLNCSGINCPTSGILLPGESSATHTFPVGVTASPATINLDNWGSPGAANIYITLTGGSQNAVVTITENTGFMP